MKKLLLLAVGNFLFLCESFSLPTYAVKPDAEIVGSCPGCSVKGPENAVSGNLNDYALLDVADDVKGFVRLSLIFPDLAGAGSYVSVVVEDEEGKPLNDVLLGTLKLRLYNGNMLTETKTSTQVAKSSYQGSPTKTILSWKASSTYDRVMLELGSSKSCFTLRVYFACHDSGPLPVSFLNFTGKPENGRVKLLWATASEFNNDYFSIERSSNGIDFEELGVKKGAGNSNTMLYYAHTDEKPLLGKVYYRIKQVDFDKKFGYSNLIVVDTYDNTGKPAVSVFPNPSNGSYVYLSVKDDKSPLKITLFDGNGREIPAGKYSVEYRNDMYEIHFAEKLAKGVYPIAVEGKEGNAFGSRLVVNQ